MKCASLFLSQISQGRRGWRDYLDFFFHHFPASGLESLRLGEMKVMKNNPPSAERTGILVWCDYMFLEGSSTLTLLYYCLSRLQKYMLFCFSPAFTLCFSPVPPRNQKREAIRSAPAYKRSEAYLQAIPPSPDQI